MSTPRIVTLPENTKGRDFVVGDIHGCFELFEKALAAVGFDPQKDRVISVGDLVDRGPESPQCLYYLNQPWFHAIRGNHEEILMRLFQDGVLNEEGVKKNIPHGMGWMLDETTDSLQDIRDAMQKLPLVIEVETAMGKMGFVHADVPKDMDWDTFKHNINTHDKDTRITAQWSRKRVDDNNDQGVDGITRIFLGHTPVDSGPLKLGNCFFVDTGGVFKLIGENRTDNLFLTLADITASDHDLVRPQPTSDDLVRVITADKTKTPANDLTPPPPSRRYHPPQK